jgi:hypothetical protein
MQVVHPLSLAGRDALAQASVDLHALDLFVQDLRHAPKLQRNELDGRPQ